MYLTQTLNRGQIAVVLLAHIFEMDNDELDDLFCLATGQHLTPAECHPDTGDTWKCDWNFNSYFDPDQHRILDYLRSLLPAA